MPYPFKLPTTALVAFQDYLSSSTHPSLPFAATAARAVVRGALKKHKRLPALSQAPHLTDVLAALNDYLHLLSAIDAGLSGCQVAGEDIDIVLEKDIHMQWRAVLLASLPGREPPRLNLQSLECELLFALSTTASANYLIARSCLYTLYNAATPTTEQRTTATSTAMKHFLEANSIYSYMSTRAAHVNTPSSAPDIAASTSSALASLALAEATLLAVYKEDPYPAAVAQERNKLDKEWMYKSPDITSVRASLFARLCIAAADHGSKAAGMIAHSAKVVDSLLRYVGDVRRVARAKSFRFLAIDADLAGKTGEAIAWLHAAQVELGFPRATPEEGRKSKGLNKFKKDLAEKREDKKTEKGQDWGSDAGRIEEWRVVEALLAKWIKMNSIMNVQTIPPYESLLAKLPSGREFHSPKVWVVPMLDSSTLTRMHAPPLPSNTRLQGEDEDSDDESPARSAPAGAFPGTEANYNTASSYY